MLVIRLLRVLIQNSKMFSYLFNGVLSQYEKGL
jgi:hypothetical protein